MTLRELANRKAAFTRHLGPDDPRTLAAASALRVAKLKKMLAEPPLTEAEREELLAVLTVA